MTLKQVTLTGIDNNTSIEELIRLRDEYPLFEPGILYTPYKQGTNRNPTNEWIEEFYTGYGFSGSVSTHLCGKLAFEQLMESSLPRSVFFASRVQLNVNSRVQDFSDSEVLDIFHRAFHSFNTIILQYNSNTMHVIEKFIKSVQYDSEYIHVLLDESKGKGVYPDSWDIPSTLINSYCGFAGGINPDNVSNAVATMSTFDVPYWIDMESGIRSYNNFDMKKARAVLEATK